jgi:hypothetical protein
MEERNIIWIWDAKVMFQSEPYFVNATVATLKVKDSVNSRKTGAFSSILNADLSCG